MRSEKLRFFLNLKTLMYLIIVATAAFSVVFTYLHNVRSDGYILGDWLINYQDGGFKRRGLSGSFFFLLQDVSGIKLNILVFAAQFLIITTFFWNFFKLIQHKTGTWLYLSLLLSSIGFVGIFNCVDYVGKKEFIVFLIFAWFVRQLDHNKLSLKKECFVAAALFITMFLHEVALFFVPYFVIALYLKTGKWEFRRYLKYILAVFVPAVLLFFFGKNINEGQSLQILADRGVVFSRGIFFWNIDERAYIAEHYKEYRLYFLSLIISVLHLYFYLKFQKNGKKTGLMLILAFLFSLPLFYLAIDWGRWMYIHMIFIIILMSLFLEKSTHAFESEKTVLNAKFFVTVFIIFFSLCYRVEMSGSGFTWHGFFYRTLIASSQLLNKMR